MHPDPFNDVDRAASLQPALAANDWAALAAALSGSREPQDVFLRTLARNLIALAEHRPEVYGKLIAHAEDLPASAAPDRPDARVLAAFAESGAYRAAGRAVAIAGVGDGTLLRNLVRFAPSLTLGREQEIVVIEPEPGRLLDALGRTDLTGPRGAIAQPRVAWYVGHDWAERYADDLIAQPTRHLADLLVSGGEPRHDVAQGIEAVTNRLVLVASAQRVAIEGYYDALDDGELVDCFGPTPPRPPRVLLLTSQFTTVLQYSTYDSADAFRQLGWDVHVCTEPKPWHGISKSAIRTAIADVKPDLVFQIDHLRYELGDLVPPRLPFVCWIQDHMVNLTSAHAGASVGERDFVLTGATYRYVARHGYPRRQCVDMPKVARAPALPTSWAHDREDVFYVSHWSQTPESIIVETVGRVREIAGPAAEATMRACANALQAVYASGGAVRLDLEMRTLVRDVAAGRGATLDAETERFFVDVLFQRLNNAFFRQQALTWTGQIANELGLKFGIYGKGWEQHPTLGRFARGVVTYGPDLEALTRQSKVMLQLEPYPCYSHQRMLDALLAGGFALVRAHPFNTLPVKVRQFLDAHVPIEANNVSDARDALPTDALRDAFDRLLVESASIAAMGDVVDVVRGWQRAGTIGDGDATLPHLDQITFDDFAGLRSHLARFVSDASARRQIADAQRACVEQRLTYVGALGRALRVMHGRLADSVAAARLKIVPDLSVSEAA